MKRSRLTARLGRIGTFGEACELGEGFLRSVALGVRQKAPPVFVTFFAKSMIYSYRNDLAPIGMANAVKKTISLPADLAREAEALAEAEGKTLSTVIQDALRQARIARRGDEFRAIQGYWSRKARDNGILTEEDLERYLAE